MFIRVLHSHSANQEPGIVVSKDVLFLRKDLCITVARNVGKCWANDTVARMLRQRHWESLRTQTKADSTRALKARQLRRLTKRVATPTEFSNEEVCKNSRSNLDERF